MAKAIHQFRFYSDDELDSRNEPSSLAYIDAGGMKAFEEGWLFTAEQGINQIYVPILQLGIQSIPGTQFYLNGGTEPIIIGSTGIYELDMSNNVQITQLKFNGESLRKINEMQNGYLIVDIIYEREEE